jgi:hypothetical protein
LRSHSDDRRWLASGDPACGLPVRPRRRRVDAQQRAVERGAIALVRMSCERTRHLGAGRVIAHRRSPHGLTGEPNCP